MIDVTGLRDGERDVVLRQIAEAATEELVSRMARDPERYTETALAGLYRALAGHGTGYLTAEEDHFVGKLSIRKREILRRIELVQAHADDEERQKAAFAAIKDDPKVLFDDWLWMTDPRLKGLRTIPFRLFDIQRRVIDFIMESQRAGESCQIKKSRDLGISVIAAGIGTALWLTWPASICTYGSRKEDLVHKKGDLDSLLEKVSVVLRLLPAWMIPDGFKERDHFNFMNVINPVNGAQLKGEAGEELGRGGRATIFFADEFAFVKEQKKSQEALSATTDCTVYFSTSGGVNTHFYLMEKRRMYRFMKVPWHHDERKLDSLDDLGNPKADSSWRRKKLKELGGDEAAFGREYACEDEAGLDETVCPLAWVDAAIDLKLEAGSETVAGLDIGGGGPDESVLIIRRGGLVVHKKVWTRIEPKYLAPRVHVYCTAFGVQYLYYDHSGIGSTFEGPIRAQNPPYKVMGIDAQRPADKLFRYDDDPSKPAAERFANKTTELWWSLRRRFHRTWEHVNGNATYPHDELISIPNDALLISQLSTRKFFMNGQGKLQLEDKRKLRDSPDRADALVMAEEKRLQRLTAIGADTRTKSEVERGNRYEW